ncbi:MAG: hypothetical protein J6T53_00040 [Bacteroidales bacterium]|nr:hypothetical protein [Bacteroidales bacterium]
MTGIIVVVVKIIKYSISVVPTIPVYWLEVRRFYNVVTGMFMFARTE